MISGRSKSQIIYLSLFILALMILVLWPFVFGKTVFIGDNFNFLVSGKIFSANILRDGALPFWNHYIFSGTPHLADISQSFLYPTTLLFAWLKPSLALNVSIVIHFIIGALGMYMLSKEFGSGKFGSAISTVLWVYSQQYLAQINNLTAWQSVSYLPWLILLLLKTLSDIRWMWGLILVWVLAIVGGHPQPLTYTAIFSLIIWLVVKKPVSRKILLALITGVFVIGMSVIVVFPFAELAGHSTRFSMTTHEIINGSSHPLHLLQTILPNMFSHPQSGMIWGPDWSRIPENSFYLGFLMLVSLGYYFYNRKLQKTRIEWVFLIVGVFALLSTLGKNWPGYETFVDFVPAMRVFRNPSGAAIIWTLSISVLVGVTFPELLKSVKGRWEGKMLLILGIITLLIWATHGYWYDYFWIQIDNIVGGKLTNNGFHSIDRDAVITSILLFQIAAISLLSGLILAINSRSTRHGKKLILGLIIVEMWLSVQPILFFAKKEVYDSYESSPQSAWLETNLESGYRVLSLSGYLPFTGINAYINDAFQQAPFADSRYTDSERRTSFELLMRRNNLAPNWNVPASVPSTTGFTTMILSDTASYWQDKDAGSSINELDRPDLNDVRFDEQGVKYFMLNNLIYPQGNPMDVDGLPVAEKQLLWTVFENEQAQNLVSSSDDIEISDISLTPNQLSFTASGGEGLIKIMMANYPGWECRANNVPCEIQPSDDFGMIVNHQLESSEYVFSFMPTNWKLYAYVTTIFWVCYIVGISWHVLLPAYKRRKK